MKNLSFLSGLFALLGLLVLLFFLTGCENLHTKTMRNLISPNGLIAQHEKLVHEHPNIKAERREALLLQAKAARNDITRSLEQKQ